MKTPSSRTKVITTAVWAAFALVACGVAQACIEGNEPLLGALGLAVASGCSAMGLLSAGVLKLASPE